MREFFFSDDDLKAIAKDRYEHLHPHVQRKMEVLWLKSHGLPHQQIADLAGVSLRTVQRHLNDYLEGGLKQVRRCNWRGPLPGCAVGPGPHVRAFGHRPQTLQLLLGRGLSA